MDSGGKGTFEKIMEGIGQLKEFQVDFNILTVVNAMTEKVLHPEK